MTRVLFICHGRIYRAWWKVSYRLISPVFKRFLCFNLKFTKDLPIFLESQTCDSNTRIRRSILWLRWRNTFMMRAMAFGMNSLAIIIFRFLPCPLTNSAPLVNEDSCTGTASKSTIQSSLMTLFSAVSSGHIRLIWTSRRRSVCPWLSSRWRHLRAWQRNWKQPTRWHGLEPWTASVTEPRKSSSEKWSTGRMWYENPRGILVRQYRADWVWHIFQQRVQERRITEHIAAHWSAMIGGLCFVFEVATLLLTCIMIPTTQGAKQKKLHHSKLNNRCRKNAIFVI